MYAHNEGASEHIPVKTFLENILATSSEQIVIVHQTLFELFSVLTSAALFKRPLSPIQAWQVCEFYLTHAEIQTTGYEPAVLMIVRELLLQKPQRGKRFFDLILAATLKYHGVTRVYTRNVKHFQDYSFLEIVNPL